MIKLNNIESEILTVITRHFPFHITEITRTYEKLRSFDRTIEIIKLAILFNISLEEMTNICIKYQNFFANRGGN